MVAESPGLTFSEKKAYILRSREYFEGDSWILPTDVDLIGLADKEFVRRLKKLGWDKKEPIDALRNAFNEAMVNSMAHGNQGLKREDYDSSTNIYQLSRNANMIDPCRRLLWVDFEISRDRVYVKIRDEGNGFPFEEEKPSDNTELNEDGLLKLRGNGMTIMKAAFDVKYSDGGRVVEMTRERQKQEKVI